MFAQNGSIFPFSQIVNSIYSPQGANRPMINIQKSDGGYILEVVAPGFAKEHYAVDIDGQRLRVAASKAQVGKLSESEGETASGVQEGEIVYVRREFVQEDFERSFNLPETIDAEGISATYADGILSLRLPLREELKLQRSVSIS